MTFGAPRQTRILVSLSQSPPMRPGPSECTRNPFRLSNIIFKTITLGLHLDNSACKSVSKSDILKKTSKSFAMQAIRVGSAPSSAAPYSPSNPAPSSALYLDQNTPIPKPSKRDELLVRVKATTVIRDMLTWPESYHQEHSIIGSDVSGIVAEVGSEDCKFRPGDEIFGMLNVNRASAWAEYCIVEENEVALKPKTLSWEQAAAIPLSAQTAYEALFDHASVPVPSVEEVARSRSSRTSGEGQPRLLITGAAGAVGVYLVQLASLAGLHVVAATSSNTRNAEFLRELGAHETVEYGMLESHNSAYDIIIDTVGGGVLAKCWNYVKENGTLLSVDSASYNFVEDHEKRGIRREGVRALFFIVGGSSKALHYLAELADSGFVRPFVAGTYPFAKVQEAYDIANGRYPGRGKIVLTI
ncbi:NADP-dependent oxidoreductase [Aspergillus novofumigatus IBT 16806]|uniref:Putative zinc-containing alcohol dehydrogenase n=1 Tax=Aspergillus novofumigatus (strain IBT 16806) TaxID=1392255 RepID=A0A2I1BYY6_ASPN1|nr:putative zinc-containing alcohol dehydrogenase [Aspergillus novofumigatus IBT 16806]PKX90592.1 putative zinc-containing alcohol dehydrogenase [Aspergillus novofumigatus IBT 16806]